MALLCMILTGLGLSVTLYTRFLLQNLADIRCVYVEVMFNLGGQSIVHMTILNRGTG